MFGWNCRLFCDCVCRVFLELRRVLLLARQWCASTRRTFFNCCLAEHVQRAEHLKSSTWVHFMWMNGTNKLTYDNIAIRLVDLETEKEISLWRNSGRKRGSSLILDDCWDTRWHRGLPAGVVKSSRETMCFSAKTWAFWIFTPRLEPVYLFPSLGAVHLFAPDWSEALTHCTLVSCCQALALFVCSWIWIKFPELE